MGVILLVLVVLLVLWAAHYHFVAARKPRLDFHPSTLNRQLLQRLDPLHRPYRPTPWLCNAHLQLLWLLWKEAIAPPLCYERTERLTMRDGGTTALDWLGLDAAPATPTLLVLPTITGDAQSMGALVTELRRATGWRVAVCTRRGHGGLPLTAPLLDTMGSTDDLREQLQHIRRQCPESPLYGVGVSAGSALLVRYLGEEGSRSLIRAGVACCPGYDIAVAWTRVQPLYDRALTRRLKRYFLEPHAQVFAHLDSWQACLAARNLQEFHERLYEVAGCASHADYLARSNPMGVFDRITVPLLVLNAEDDPVCRIENALDHLDAIRQIPDALLVRTARGSHCAHFAGWTAQSWASRLLADYLLAAHALLR